MNFQCNNKSNGLSYEKQHPRIGAWCSSAELLNQQPTKQPSTWWICRKHIWTCGFQKAPTSKSFATRITNWADKGEKKRKKLAISFWEKENNYVLSCESHLVKKNNGFYDIIKVLTNLISHYETIMMQRNFNLIVKNKNLDIFLTLYFIMWKRFLKYVWPFFNIMK